MQFHAVLSTFTAGASTLITPPAAGYRIRVIALHISTGGASKVTIGFSATNQRVFNMAANQLVEIGSTMDWEGDMATALSVTNGSAVELDVTVDYYIETFS